jgi:hypothetical protein
MWNEKKLKAKPLTNGGKNAAGGMPRTRGGEKRGTKGALGGKIVAFLPPEVKGVDGTTQAAPRIQGKEKKESNSRFGFDEMLGETDEFEPFGGHVG